MGEAAEAADLLRDPFHVRNYTEEEWQALFENAGLVVEETRRRHVLARRPLARAIRLQWPEADQVRTLLADRIEDDWIRSTASR